MAVSPTNIDPSARLILALGILLSAIWSVVYLLNPDFIEHLNFKLTDTIVTSAQETDITGKIVVVDIDEPSLEAWGQWPWPRSQMGILLSEIAGMGAKCIALDFIMAEPDRTSQKTIKKTLIREFSYPQNESNSLAMLQDNDTILANTLSSGPFVLGYEFGFSPAHQRNTDCHIRPLKMIKARQPSRMAGRLGLYQARDVICNIAQLAQAAPQSGFLNGQPDGDGLMRRLPLVMSYHQAVYPSFALAAVLGDANPQTAALEQCAGTQYCLIVGDYAIPIDENGNMRVRFSTQQSNLNHISADRILEGQVDASDIKNRIVIVGLNASGLTQTYQTPVNGRLTAVDVHAQAIETILSGAFIRRHTGMIQVEVILSLLVGMLFSLCIARFEFVKTTMIGVAGIAALWGGAHVLFITRQILLSPLLPTTVIISSVLFLMLFKYWTRQQKARRNMQDALILMKSSEENLNSIISTIPDIVFRLDAAGRITFISPALIKYKRQPEELIGQHILDLVVPEDRDLATFRINERRTGRRATSDLEVRMLLSPKTHEKSGKERYFSVSAEGIYSNVSPNVESFMGTQGIARDINQRKYLEQKLEHSKKFEAMGSLAAGVAHDLNNILSGLVSYPELLLLDLPPGSPLKNKIKIIQRSGQRAADIVQDLLMIARRSVKNHEIININDAVTGYLDTPEFNRLTESHSDLRLATHLADDLMNIKGSPIHISKMIMNLVSNAAEAMPAGGTVYIQTFNRYLDTVIDRYERIPEGEYVMLCVSDEGVGIHPQSLHRIFEPFYSKKRLGGSGSGLGMTVVWNTIKDHAGFVDIRSKEGDGTRFELYLPATRAKNNQTDRRTVLQDYTGTERLLVVDDIPEQRDIATRMLSKLGYKVTSASGGGEAIAYLKNHVVDLVVLDMVMPPGMDGLETYQRILKINPGQKVIIASGYAPTDRVKAMQESGAGEYIRKPYTMEKIGLAVRNELDQ